MKLSLNRSTSLLNSLPQLACMIAWLMINFFRASCGNFDQWNFYVYPVVMPILFAGSFWVMRSNSDKPIVSVLTISLFSLVPLGIGLTERWIGYGSDPWEILALSTFSSCSVLLGVCSPKKSHLQSGLLMAVVTCFAALAMDDGLWVRVLGLTFSGVILLWLVQKSDHGVEIQANRKTVHRQGGKSLALLASVVIFLAVGSFLSGFRGRVSLDWVGISPFSGGTKWDDPYARDGIGDGQLLTAAKDSADTIGPVDSDIFLESKGLTLFDVASEQFGEPRKPNGNRAIALAQKVLQHNHKKESLGTKTASSTNFSIARKRPNGSSKQAAYTDALFFVKGPTPLHLPVTILSTCENGTWMEKSPIVDLQSEDVRRTLKQPLLLGGLQKDKPWMAPNWLRSDDGQQTLNHHQIQINTLESLQFPAPYRLQKFCIDKVDRAAFFRITKYGFPLLHNGCPRIPKMTVLHTRSQPFNLFTVWKDPEGARESLQKKIEQFQAELDCFESSDQIRKASKAVFRTSDSDWQKVRSVADFLQTNYELDRNVATNLAPEGQEVSAFLKKRQGPDYLFATAASLLLRGQKIPSRIASGFYADPKRADMDTGQVAVIPQDMHFWVEVCLDGETWIPVDVCPGYLPPTYQLSLYQHCELFFWNSLRWIRNHPIFLFSLLVCSVQVFVIRKWIRDGIRTFFHWIGIRFSNRHPAISTAKLVEWRAQMAGIVRPIGMSLPVFIERLAGYLSNLPSAKVSQFSNQLNRALYSPASISLSADKSHSAMSEIVSGMSYRAIIRLRREKPNILQPNSFQKDEPNGSSQK